MHRFSTIVFITMLLAFVVVSLGAYVRLSDAGLGCPDWPGCYGQLLGVPQTPAEHAAAESIFPHAPVDIKKAWKEVVHRYVAGALGLLILAIFIFSWRYAKERLLASLLLIVVVVQAALGMWTVTLLLKPAIVTAHLLGGMTTLGLLVTLYLRLRHPLNVDGEALILRDLAKPSTNPHRPGRSFHRFMVGGVIVLVLGQIALGGWVSSNYAALACPDFPTCHGNWLPQVSTADWSHAFDIWRHLGQTREGALLSHESLRAIHWVHRLGALIIAFLITILGALLWRSNRRLGLLLIGVLIAQITLGILNVLFSLPLALAVAHNLGAALLLTLLLIIFFRPQS